MRSLDELRRRVAEVVNGGTGGGGRAEYGSGDGMRVSAPGAF